MRKLRFPSWLDWQTGLEQGINTALKQSQIVSYRLDGTPTNSAVTVKSQDQNQGTMPYVEVILADNIDGHDDQGSGDLDREGYTYTSVGNTKTLVATNYYRERIMFSIDVYTQKYSEGIKIAQTIKQYFGLRGISSITWQSATHRASSKLSNYTIEATESDRKGNIDYFRISYDFELSIKSDLLTADEISGAVIQEVVTEITSSITSGNGSEETKTIT